jgi:hypothetical protein
LFSSTLLILDASALRFFCLYAGKNCIYRVRVCVDELSTCIDRMHIVSVLRTITRSPFGTKYATFMLSYRDYGHGIVVYVVETLVCAAGMRIHTTNFKCQRQLHSQLPKHTVSHLHVLHTTINTSNRSKQHSQKQSDILHNPSQIQPNKTKTQTRSSCSYPDLFAAPYRPAPPPKPQCPNPSTSPHSARPSPLAPLFPLSSPPPLAAPAPTTRPSLPAPSPQNSQTSRPQAQLS